MVSLTYEVSVGVDGTLTFPPELLETLGLQAGDTINVVETADHLVLIPKRLLVPEFADYMSQLLTEKGLTITDLLVSGAEIREELLQERYGDIRSG